MLQEAMDFIQSGKITAEKYVTHVYPLERVREAFKMAMNPYDSIKAMLEPQASFYTVRLARTSVAIPNQLLKAALLGHYSRPL